jgi:hypothetical protein
MLAALTTYEAGPRPEPSTVPKCLELAHLVCELGTAGMVVEEGLHPV